MLLHFWDEGTNGWLFGFRPDEVPGTDDVTGSSWKPHISILTHFFLAQAFLLESIGPCLGSLRSTIWRLGELGPFRKGIVLGWAREEEKLRLGMLNTHGMATFSWTITLSEWKMAWKTKLSVESWLNSSWIKQLEFDSKFKEKVPRMKATDWPWVF